MLKTALSPKNKPEVPVLIEASYHFLKHLRQMKNASEHTIRSYAVDLNALKNFIEREHYAELPPEELPAKIRHNESYEQRFHGKDSLITLKAIDKKILRSFLADLNRQGRNTATVVRRLSSLRTFFKYALGQNLVDRDPTEGLERPKLEKKIPICLSHEQIKKLMEQPDTTDYLGFRDRTILELFYSSGIRISELVGLNRKDVDTQARTMRIRGKGKKERLIPITENAAFWLQSYLEHSERHRDFDGVQAEKDPEAIFLNKNGNRLSARSVDRNFEKHIKACGIPKEVTPHSLRHTIATHWLEQGMDLKTIQEILGHSHIAATTIYTKVSPKLKKEVYDAAHPRA